MKVSDAYGPQQVQVSNQKDTAAAKEAEERRRQEQQDQVARQGDRVEISTASREVARAKEATTGAAETRADKVAEIKAQLDEGRYEVDARKVADRMLQDVMKDLV
ncbi:MAG: flagellar biosynthesis anti-sigma factor FlgM [Proteobacteria bacterium]|nr:flagellar biosynthesis anti-sigma factor FlgM [Pseudomonadota bacterium]